MQKMNVICFGNEWHGDDAFGAHVYSRLVDQTLPAHCAVFYAGGSTHTIPMALLESEYLVVIDTLFTLDSSSPELRWLELEEFLAYQAAHLHDASVAQWLKHLPILLPDGALPEVKILVATANRIQGFSDSISQDLQGLVQVACDLVIDTMRREQVV